MDLTSYFIHAPLSALYTLLLACSMAIFFDYLGRFIFAQDHPLAKALYFFSGLLLTSWLIFILSLCGFATVAVLKSVSIAFIIPGMYILAKHRNFFVADIVQTLWQAPASSLFNKTAKYGILCTLACLIILSLAPPTDADSLDYHLGIPVEILSRGNLWLNTDIPQYRLLGYGEMLNLLGVANGCPQLSTLLQVIGLMLLILAYIDSIPDNKRTLMTAMILGVPALLFLIPNQKNQLIGVICTSLCFYVITFRQDLLKEKIFHLVVLSLLFAVSIKYSFIISAVAIGFYLLIKTPSVRLAIKHVSIIALWSVIFLAPLFVFKYIHYGDPLSPFLERFTKHPDLIIINFGKYLEGFSDSKFPFPINLFIPSSPGNISTILGWSAVLIILFVLKSKQYTKELLAVGLFFVLTILFGQKTPRFFLEPYWWVLPLVIAKVADKQWGKYFLVPAQLQFLCLVPFFLYGTFTLLPGIISNKGREHIMQQYANGYNEAVWIKEHTPKGKMAASFVRSRALLGPSSIPRQYLFLLFSKDITDSTRVAKMLKDYRVQYLVLTPRQVQLMQGRYPLQLVAGPTKFYNASRNLFNRKEYELAMYQLDMPE